MLDVSPRETVDSQACCCTTTQRSRAGYMTLYPMGGESHMIDMGDVPPPSPWARFE